MSKQIDSKLQLKINGNYYTIFDFLNKTLFSESDIKVYDHPSTKNGKVIKTVKASQPIGVVTTFMYDYDGSGIIFFGVDNGAGWIKYTDLNFNVNSLEKQGLATTKEKQTKRRAEADKEEKTFGDKIIDMFKKFGFIILILIVVYLALTQFNIL